MRRGYTWGQAMIMRRCVADVRGTGPGTSNDIVLMCRTGLGTGNDIVPMCRGQAWGQAMILCF